MKTQKKWSLLQTGKLCSKFGALILSIIFLSACDDDETPPPADLESNVRIVAVDAANDQVTLRNFGEGDADISGFFFCRERNYAPFSSTTNDGSDLILTENEEITFTISVSDQASDVAIYNQGGQFASADALVDFMQFGGSFANNGREAVAVEKGIWTAGEFVEGGSPFSYIGNGTQNGAAQWEGEAVQAPITSSVRLVFVDPINDLVTLKNFGREEEDISGYFFCRRRSYVGLGTLTPVSGDLTLSADEEVQFSLTIDDASSDVALYANNSGFANADNIIDFFQFGANVGGAGRIDVAVAAQIWNDGEFTDGIAPFTYLGDASGVGASLWGDNANIRMVSINPATDEVTIKNFDTQARDISDYFFCTLAGVYPSFSTAADIEVVNGDFNLDPNEEVTVRVLTTDGVVDENGSIFLFSSNALGFNNANSVVLRDFAQWDVGNGFRVDNAVTAGRWDNAASFIEGTEPFVFTGGGNDVGADFWTGSTSNVRILSLDPATDKVVLKNFGNATQDISGYWFCRRKAYASIANLTPTSGDLVLDANEEVEFTITIDDNSSDFALYNQGGAFANPDAILDFVMFGDDIDDAGRESVAVSAGIWTEDEFVNGVGPYNYDGDGSANGANQWNATATGSAKVRLLTVDASNDRVVLKNFGDASMDISSYFFCRRKAYSGLSTLTVTSGNLILAPNEELEFTLTINDTSSDVALYLNNSGFANPANIVDFMQFGEDVGSAGREDVAVGANIWPENDFVANPGPFQYTGDGDQNGATFWD
ncbi:MAG: hypothetical protein AAFX87_06010 [Bacteroidota bacterium]